MPRTGNLYTRTYYPHETMVTKGIVSKRPKSIMERQKNTVQIQTKNYKERQTDIYILRQTTILKDPQTNTQSTQAHKDTYHNRKYCWTKKSPNCIRQS